MDRVARIQRQLVAGVTPLAAEQVSLAAVAGRFLAAPVLARRPAPPFTCSAMDGFAVRSADVPGPTWLAVGPTLYAGDLPGPPLGEREAGRIFTGAPLPPGADAVVRGEAAREDDGAVSFGAAARPGENVRLVGEDVAAGGVALPAGFRLGPRQLALLAAVGAEAIAVVRRPRVALLTTGDEIVSGRTPDSNGAGIEAALRALGAQVERRAARDDREEIARAVRELLASADALVTVGGVSVGARDHVAAAVASAGAEVEVHGVPMKPGKPFLFARAGGKPIFGLPGSPSACLVAFEVMARPALLRLAGAARLFRRALRLPLAEAVEGRPGRARFLWARLEEGGAVRPVGREAAQVRGPALADALLCVPEKAGLLAEGELAECWLLEDDAA